MVFLLIALFTGAGAKAQLFEPVTVATPAFNPSAGPITNGTTVSISCATAGAVIHYTLDGTEPTGASPLYVAPILLNGNTTLKATAIQTDYQTSFTNSILYRLKVVEATVVTTLAGSGTPGFADGSPSVARFNGPLSICADTAGNLYIADSNNHRIRKISPTGQVTTVAGSGIAGSMDGVGTNAQFDTPAGVCVDGGGIIYVAEKPNSIRIRKIGTDGTVTTLNSRVAGSLYWPWQLDIDPSGNLYAGTRRNGTGPPFVIRINPAGQASYYLYDSDNRDCTGVGTDAQNNFYVAVSNVIVSASAGAPFPSAGGADIGHGDGDAGIAIFESLQDVAVGAGYLYVTEPTRVRKMTTNGWVTTLAGSSVSGYLNGSGRVAQFNAAAGLCVDFLGNVYVCDSGNHRIRKIWKDSDGDGIPDLLEGGSTPYVVGVDDRFIDTDGDGQSNASEFWAGTDPRDPNSLIVVSTIVGESSGQVTVSWRSQSGVPYQVQYSDDLQLWNNLGSVAIGTGTTMSMMDPNAISTVVKRFYRVVLADLSL